MRGNICSCEFCDNKVAVVNYYRTPMFIVKQCVTRIPGLEGAPVYQSKDIFIQRNPVTDALYEAEFGFRGPMIEGQRFQARYSDRQYLYGADELV